MKSTTTSIAYILIGSFFVSALFVFTVSSCTDNTKDKTPTTKVDRKAALKEMMSKDSPQIDEMIEDVTSLGFVEEDDSSKDSLRSAIQLFKAGSIDSARVAFETYLATYEDDQIGTFFNGLCQFEKGRFSSAIKIIQPLVKDDTFEYKDCATYYLAMAYFALDKGQGDDMAKKYFNLLANNSSSHYQKEAKAYVEQFL